MPQVALVAHDIGAAKPLNMVAGELIAVGAEVKSFFRGSMTPQEQALVGMSDVVLVGMSSSEAFAEDELEVCRKAKANGRPFALFADIEATVGRPWFAELRQDAAMVFVINDRAAANAGNLFPNAKVVVSGNPSWEAFFKPSFSRSEVRAKVGVSDDAVMLLVPLGKDLAVNRLHISGVAESARQLGRKTELVIAMHPGDQNRSESYQESLGDVTAHFIAKKNYEELGMKGDDLVAGADVVVPSASTVGVTAACQRIPVVNYFSEVALARLEAATGSRQWPPVADGTEAEVSDGSVHLMDVLEDIISGSRSMKKEQETIYPAAKGGAAAYIAKQLLSLVPTPKK